MRLAQPISGPRRPLFFPHSEALMLGYDPTPLDLQDLSSSRVQVVGIQNPNTAGVAAGTSAPMLEVARDFPLIEPAGLRTHYGRQSTCLQSQSLNLAPWVLTRAQISADAAIAPDWTTTAEKLYDDNTAASSHYIKQTIACLNSTQYCASVFAHVAEYSNFRIQYATVANARCDFDLVAGTATPVGGMDYAFIEDWGQGWFRCAMVFTTGLADAGNRILAFYLDNGTGITYNGDNVSGLYLWGAQFEAGHAPSPYIETAAIAVTSNAPVYLYSDPAVLYHGGRGTIDHDFIFSIPYLPPQNNTVYLALYELTEVATGYRFYLRYGYRVGGLGMIILLTDDGAQVTQIVICTAWAPAVNVKYLFRTRWTGGTTWTVDIYSCDAAGSPTAFVETLAFNTPGFPPFDGNADRLYLGCNRAGAAQSDLHIWQVGT